MWSVLLFLASFSFAFQIPPKALHGENHLSSSSGFGLLELKTLIEKKNLRTPEQVIERLPAPMLRNYTLIHSSLSLQSASPENPRAVLFQPDGQLILTFNGHPSQKGFHALEIADFNPLTKRISFHEIAFDPQGKHPPTISNPNPAKCMSCHGIEGVPRYIWSSYDNWDGAYGQIDDRILENDTTQFLAFTRYLKNEKAQFQNFRQLAESHPRYRFLQQGTEKHPYFPYNSSSNKSERSFEVLPNARLGWLMVTNFADAVAEKILQRPSYVQVRYSLLYTMLCSSDMDKKINESALRRLMLFSESEYPLWDVSPKDPYNLAMGNLSRFTTFELNPKELSGRKFDYTTGALHVEQVIAAFMLKKELERNPELGSKLKFDDVVMERKDYDYAYNHADFPEDIAVFSARQMVGKMMNSHRFSPTEHCRQLREGLRAELKATYTGKPQNRSQPLQALSGRTILHKARCVSCHSTEAFDVGPPIPFADEAALKTFAQNYRSEAGLSFPQELAYRISFPKSPRPGEREHSARIMNDHMPRGGGYLTASEARTVIRYVERLMEK